MFKKAQAAMEFLMTYGWAILVVLVVIGALSYFGVLSPATLLPEKCTFPVQVSCVDHSVSATSVTVVLQNGAGRDMIVHNITASSDALGGATGNGVGDNRCWLQGTQRATILRNGARDSFLLNADAPDDGGSPPGGIGCNYRNIGRDKNRYAIDVTYAWLDSPNLNHSLPGELLARGP